MAEEGGKRGPLTQIIVAVIIALLVGGSSPWWWKEFRPQRETQQTPPDAGPSRDSAPDSRPNVTPTTDFPNGSRPVYAAAFAQWPAVGNEHGSAGPLHGEYVIRPSSNAWIGPGQALPVTPLPGDFLFEANFRITEANPEAALELKLVGSGDQAADYVAVYLEIWAPGKATYTLQKGWIKDQFYDTPDQTLAEREPLDPVIAGSDWSKPSKLTLKRERGEMQLFVNDVFVRSFPVPLFTVTSVAVAAVFPSVVTLASLSARTPP